MITGINYKVSTLSHYMPENNTCINKRIDRYPWIA